MGYAAYFHGQALLSWVPHQLISKVQSGTDANPEGCIKRAEMVSERYGDQRQQKRMLFRSESQSSLMVTAAKKVTATVTNAAPMIDVKWAAPFAYTSSEPEYAHFGRTPSVTTHPIELPVSLTDTSLHDKKQSFSMLAGRPYAHFLHANGRSSAG